MNICQNETTALPSNKLEKEIENVINGSTTNTNPESNDKILNDIITERKRLYNKKYNIIHKKFRNEQARKYRKEHKDEQRKYRESRKEQRKKYDMEHKEIIREQTRKYKEEHRETIREQTKKYNDNRRKTDINYRLKGNLRTRMNRAIGGNYKSGSAVKDLGCSIEEFRSYIASQFLPGMSWDNWSKTGWHIDHIKPLNMFDLTDRKQLLEACHYTNQRPMWATDNYNRPRDGSDIKV